MPTSSFTPYDEAIDTLDFPYNYNEKETKLLNEAANRNGRVDIDMLRRIALWKLDRVLDVPSKTIKKLQSLATQDDLRVDSGDTRSLIEELIECPGIGLPMASTILKFLRPDVFPIIDVRACRALYGRKVYFNQSSAERNVEFYVSYAVDIQRISQNLKRPLREIDEQLYEFDKKRNGTI